MMARTPAWRITAILLVAFVLAVSLVSFESRPTSATHVTPVLVANNPQCSGLGYASSYRNQSPADGTFPVPADGSVGSITIDVNGVLFNFTSTFGIDVVIVKGGPDGNVYTYDPPAETNGDTGLHAPANPGNQNQGFYGLSHIEFCFDIEAPATETPVPTDTPTNTPTNTPTDTPTNTPTNTPTDTPTNTPTDTPTNTPTDTPTNTPTDTPTNTPTDTPTNTPTDTPTNTPTDTPTNTPTDTPTNSPTDTPTDTPTNTPTFTPTNTPISFEGCTPGFWRNQGLPAYDSPSDALPLAVQAALAGTSPSPDVAWAGALFRDVFDLTPAQMSAAGLNPSLTINQAIKLGGGGFNALARHGAAAILSAASVNFEFTVAEVYSLVHDPIANNNPSAAAANAAALGAANNASHQNCPTG